jgi:hypothetical protein
MMKPMLFRHTFRRSNPEATLSTPRRLTFSEVLFLGAENDVTRGRQVSEVV